MLRYNATLLRNLLRYPTGYGRVVLGGYMMAAGAGLSHWHSMMESKDTEHIKSHQLLPDK